VAQRACHRAGTLTGQDPEGRSRTIILWQETDLVDGVVQRRVVVTLDATMRTATVLTVPKLLRWRRRCWRLPSEHSMGFKRSGLAQPRH
jgi:hypothetical protein